MSAKDCGGVSLSQRERSAVPRLWFPYEDMTSLDVWKALLRPRQATVWQQMWARWKAWEQGRPSGNPTGVGSARADRHV